MVADGMPTGLVTADQIDFLARPEDQRRPLMEACRGNIEDALSAVGGFAACLLDERGDRIGLVEKSQPRL